MNREMNTLREIIFVNWLDAGSLISNTSNETDPAILRIYQITAAYLMDLNHDFLIHHLEQNNIAE